MSYPLCQAQLHFTQINDWHVQFQLPISMNISETMAYLRNCPNASENGIEPHSESS